MHYIAFEGFFVEPWAVVATVHVTIYILAIWHNSLLEIKMADEVGFEPTEVLPSTVFKTVALSHSATHPFTQDPGARKDSNLRSLGLTIKCSIR